MKRHEKTTLKKTDDKKMQERNDWTNNLVPKYTDIFASDIQYVWMNVTIDDAGKAKVVKSKMSEELIQCYYDYENSVTV